MEAGLEDAAGADEVAWEAVNGGGYGEVGLGGFEGGFQGGGVRVEFGAEAGVASGEGVAEAEDVEGVGGGRARGVEVGYLAGYGGECGLEGWRVGVLIWRGHCLEVVTDCYCGGRSEESGSKVAVDGSESDLWKKLILLG